MQNILSIINYEKFKCKATLYWLQLLLLVYYYYYYYYYYYCCCCIMLVRVMYYLLVPHNSVAGITFNKHITSKHLYHILRQLIK
jgi:hypothetical protein